MATPKASGAAIPTVFRNAIQGATFPDSNRVRIRQKEIQTEG